jgi:uncharacterized coiled-coil protein SlyX
MASEAPKGINTGRIVSIVIGAALVAALAFFMYSYYNLKQVTEEKDLNIENLTAEIEQIEQDLDEYKEDLENKDMALEEKERLLAEKEQLLVEKQKKIDQLVKNNKITQAEAEQLRGKVEQLEFYIKKYQQEIDELKAQLAEKEVQIATMGGQIDTITGKLKVTEGQLEETTFKLETAKILNARPFYYYRTKTSGKEIEETSFKVGQLEGMRICFDINQNLAADRGAKEIYLQVKGPDHKVIRDESKTAFFRANGEDLAYSSKTTIEYNREPMKVCIAFDKPSNYVYGKGDYEVIVFCEGYDIGHSKFVVK